MSIPVFMAKRFLQAIPLLFIVSVMSFTMLKLAPVDPLAHLRANPSISQAAILAEEKRLGLDKPPVIQYGIWLRNMLRGDLTPRQAQKAYDVAYDMTHSGGSIYEAKKTISEGYETIKAINARTDLTDEEKYEKSSRIRAKMCELALEVNQEFAKYQEKWVTGESLLTGMLKTLNGGTTIKKQK